jgi:glycosyl hydrolase family 130 (putative beta-1,4-mannooligosaccharide phosphorylase)
VGYGFPSSSPVRCIAVFLSASPALRYECSRALQPGTPAPSGRDQLTQLAREAIALEFCTGSTGRHILESTRERVATLCQSEQLDLEHSERVLLRCDSWVFGPEAEYERMGDVGNVAFPCGAILVADGDTLHVYYGPADSSIPLATGSIRELLRWLDRYGRL